MNSQSLTRGDSTVFTCMIGGSKVSENTGFLIKNIGMLSNSGLNGGSTNTVLGYVLYYCSSSIF